MSACVGVSPVLVGPRVQHLMYSAFTIKDEDTGGKNVRPSHLVLWRDKKKKKDSVTRAQYKKDPEVNFHRCYYDGITS